MSNITYKTLNETTAMLEEDGKPLCVATRKDDRWSVQLDERLSFGYGRGIDSSFTLPELVENVKRRYRTEER
jgi:hypothetical protein